MNILIIKLSALGDVVQAIPTFEALRQHYPTAHISWLVEEENADLLLHYPGLDEVLVCQRRLWLQQLKVPSLWPAVVSEIGRFCRWLRQRHYDLIIDLQGLLKSGIWTGLARGARKIGFGRSREGSWLFLNERLPPYDPNRHALERYLDVAHYLGAEAAGVRVRRFWTPEEEQHMENRLSEIALDFNGPLVAIHPVARWHSKQWSEKHFSSLARHLVEALGVKIIFTGSAGNHGAVSRIIEQAGGKRLFNWAGTTSLRELAFLYYQAAVVVSTDSGPMHLAAALGTPVVALFGPTAPWRTGPYGEGHHVFWADLDCSPCFQRECETTACMAALNVDEIFQAVGQAVRKQLRKE